MTRSAKKAKAPSMNDLAGKLWTALEAAETLLTHEDPAVKLKAIGAMGAVGSAYAKVHSEAQRERRRTENPFYGEDNPFASLLD